MRWRDPSERCEGGGEDISEMNREMPRAKRRRGETEDDFCEEKNERSQPWRGKSQIRNASIFKDQFGRKRQSCHYLLFALFAFS